MYVKVRIQLVGGAKDLWFLSPLGNQRLPLESVFHPPKDLL